MLPSVRSRVREAVLDRIPGVLRRGPAAGRRVALTFDDGPDHMTERYLDALDRLAVPATFFVNGVRADAHPELARDYVRRGHQVASHGYDHQRFTKLGTRALLDQCARTEGAIGGQLSGRPWVRPPHGALDASTLATLLAAGYTVAMWSLDPRDYSERDPRVLAARCAPPRAVAGDVILLHEGQQWTLDALPLIVDGLRADGLECVTMHDLFAT
jgi:peptidoglycan/xylan/chitin deacetylase (PgdA/CDA1 family)